MYEKFLSPGKIGTLNLKNRAIFPPMGSGYVQDEYPKDNLVDYHVRRVQGGCAMNIVEISTVHYTTKSPTVLGIYDDKFIPGLSKLAKGIKSAGGIAAIQIWHAGRQTSGKPFGGQPWGPSPITCNFIGEEPHAMTREEIKEIIAAYGYAAVRARKAGFDAVEIHGAHGYLIDCFLNPYSNVRRDEYGGSLENRARFGCEVIQDVRSKVGPDFPVLIRISAKENVTGGIELEDAVQAAKLYEAAGVDAIDVSQGAYDSLAYTVPPYYYPQKVNAYNAGQIKKNVRVPVIVAGRMPYPDLAEEVLQSGQADFISLGRPQLTDPDYVKKTIEGLSDEVVRCIACDQGCVGRMFAGLGVSCIFNPATGHEKEVIYTPAKKKKRVLVIGGGPGGLEAARIAQERGHKAVLFEKGIILGGQFVMAGKAPHKDEFGFSAMQMGYRAYKAGVEIHLYTPATPERIQKVKPDVVIIATGSDSVKLRIPGSDKPNVFDGRQVISADQFVAANNVVVIGGGLVGLEAMEVLLAQGKKVTVIEMLDQIGRDMEMYIRPYMFGIIEKEKVPVLTKSKCVEIGDDYVTIEKEGGRQNIKCGAVVMAVGARSNNLVVDMVKSLGIEYHVIGDAAKPGKVLEAIWGGNEIARNI